MTEWEVTAATLHEGVLDVCATSAAEPAPLRFHVPRAILEWAPGQRFFCTVDAATDAGAHVTMRGTVMRAAASAERPLLVSVGGLPMQLPGVTAKKGVGAAVCIRFTAASSAPVRRRTPDVVATDAPPQPRRSQRPRRR